MKHAWQFFLSLQDYYPERLGKMFMVHVPFVFMAIWKIVCPFIDSNTKKKVNFWICKCDVVINFSTLFCHAIISIISECSIHTSHWYKTLGLYILHLACFCADSICWEQNAEINSTWGDWWKPTPRDIWRKTAIGSYLGCANSLTCQEGKVNKSWRKLIFLYKSLIHGLTWSVIKIMDKTLLLLLIHVLCLHWY